MTDLRTLGKAMRDAQREAKDFSAEGFAKMHAAEAAFDKALSEPPASDELYVIRKRGYFYRPNANGYTSDVRQAWRVPYEVAKPHEEPNDEPVTIHKLSEFEKPAPLSEPPAAKAGINPYLYDGLLEQLYFRADNLREHPAGHADNDTWRDVASYMVAAAKAIETLKERLFSEPPAALASETQQTVSDWANETFGPAGSNVRVAARANEEMAELLRALSADDNHPKAAEEVADVVIVLMRLCTRLRFDLQAEIERKMAINRSRVWKLDATGHGYHVRNKESQS